MTTDFSWLHLTDLHQDMNEQDWYWPGVKDKLFEDLKRLHDKCGHWDLVLFTGDITQQGSPEEFQKVNEIIDEIWSKLAELGSSPILLTVPGNHDLVRPKNKKSHTLQLLKKWNRDIRTEFWNNSTSDYRQVVTEAFANYTEWWRSQKHRPDKNLNDGILPGDFSYTFNKNGAKLGVIGLNTSFLQLDNDNYKNRLALHVNQFHGACEDDGPVWIKKHNACLLITHHPPQWLNEDSKRQLYGEIINGGRFVVHICGHMHDTFYREIAEGGTDTQRIWQGRSLFGLKFFGNKVERSHGYTAGKIELNGDTGTLIFWPREARLQQGWQRRIVPDYYIALTDDQHTNPSDFKLLNSYGSSRRKLPLKNINALVCSIAKQQNQLKEWKGLHESIQKTSLKLILLRIDIITWRDDYNEILKTVEHDWTRYSDEIKGFINFNQCSNIVREAIEESGGLELCNRIKNKTSEIDNIVNKWNNQGDVKKNAFLDSLSDLEKVVNEFLTVIDKKLKSQIENFDTEYS